VLSEVTLFTNRGTALVLDGVCCKACAEEEDEVPAAPAERRVLALDAFVSEGLLGFFTASLSPSI